MTQLLISVTSIAEAELALAHGADIIDLKDPGQGALGALPLTTIAAVMGLVNAQKPVSATIGDLPMQPAVILHAVAALVALNIDFIKIGFFETDNYQPCLTSLQSLTQAGAKLIAVLFAEHRYSPDLIAAIKAAGFIGVMLDTAHKNGLTLMDHYSAAQQLSFSRQVFAHGLSLGLAGSLQLKHVADAKKINPTYIGFRGGVCDANQRQLGLDAEKIKAIRAAI
jgi:uncharacterized protein (UPF0264 family)